MRARDGGLRLATRSLIAAALLGSLTAPSAAPAPAPASDTTALVAAIDGPVRGAAEKLRDRYRHPRETLALFEVAPTHTVVEVWPGSGWYSEILAPLLREQGRYVAAGFNVYPGGPSYYAKSKQRLDAKFASAPEAYGKATVAALGPPDAWSPVPAGTADRVLTFRNVHNWVQGDFAPQMFEAFHQALKPGGILGVVDHRARPGTPLQQMKDSGYVTEELVIHYATDAGFRLVDRSEINANPADSKDYPQGVWALPPTYRLGDKDRAKYEAIGESDRMTLKFVRP
jgi:predicted methyltransferase